MVYDSMDNTNKRYYKNYELYLSYLKEIIDENKDYREFLSGKDLYQNLFYDFRRRGLTKLLQENHITEDQYKKYDELYEACVVITKCGVSQKIDDRFKEMESLKVEQDSDTIGDIFSDSTSETDIVRSDTDIIDIKGKNIGRIIKYKYNIVLDGKLPISGEFSRSDMENIYNLYSYDGQNLTQRQITRQFPELTLHTFRAILKAFGVYKSSTPIAPHIMEEYSEKECLQYMLNVKEHTIQRKIEAVKVKELERKNYDLLLQNTELVERLDTLKGLLSDSLFEDVKPFDVEIHKSAADVMVVYISDIHTGCHIPENSLYKNVYNEAVMNERFSKLAEEVIRTASLHNIREIIVNNTGDSLDGMNSETTRGGHKLPQNMDDKEQFCVYLDVMRKFMTTIIEKTKLPLHYYCVGESNHDGMAGYMANVALAMWLETKSEYSKTEVFKKMLGHYPIGNKHTLVITHGKDNYNMKKSFPVFVDARTESFINQYILENQINTKWVHFIKGDSHQTGTSYSKTFRYKSVGAMVGGTAWSFANFGKNTPCAEIEIFTDVDSENSKVTSTLIEFL